MTEQPTVRELLAHAVAGLGGSHRPGQETMAEAVGDSLVAGRHLLVQAGTGTGKSLGYLVPALLHESRVVVATATLALQHQLVERDLPALVAAIGDEVPKKPTFAVLKGRSNYACLHRIREGVPDDQGALVDLGDLGPTGAEVVALREWVEDEAQSGGTGEKDNAPRHTDRAWRQVSVSHRDCLGTKCPYATECFAERARTKASESQLVVTNHSVLAIDAVEGIPLLPEYDAVVVDEAHELVSRITQASTDQLSASEVERAARRAQRHVDGDQGDDLAGASDALRDAIAACEPGRIAVLPEQLEDALAMVREAARSVVSALPSTSEDAGLVQARGWAQDIFAIASRMGANAERDVLWVAERDDKRGGNHLSIAPLDVAGPMRDRLLADKTAIFTSATLRLGGDFEPIAASLGLERSGRDESWSAIDVGSPFDYGKQGILYVAGHLPAPGRDGLSQSALDEIVELVDAADGRALGLFSSRRAAEAAAEEVRARLPHLTTLAQGDAQLPELTRQFIGDPHTALFGTLSLWQGLDVPGETCQLVMIDRIPFPRPDDPLLSARQLAVSKAGGNGFMAVAATHAALLLAQGAGRLIRTTEDRGVVAILDSRVATARYGSFLRASLPPLWPTQDPAVARAALKRLSKEGRA